MNRFNKAILFGLISAVFGASNVFGINIEDKFEVVVKAGQQSITIDGKETKFDAITSKTIQDVLANAKVDKKLTYAVENVSNAEIKNNIATVYACWLIKVKNMSAKEANTQASSKVSGATINNEIVKDFYKSVLKSNSLFKLAVAKKASTKRSWKNLVAIYGTVGAAMLTYALVYYGPMIQQLIAPYFANNTSTIPANFTNSSTIPFGADIDGTCYTEQYPIATCVAQPIIPAQPANPGYWTQFKDTFVSGTPLRLFW